MGDTGTTNGTRAATMTSGGHTANFALWALQALLAIMFAMAGASKVFGDPAMVEMFATIGIGQWFRYLVGVLEIAGALGVLVPRLSGLAALGLVCLMVGATLTNAVVLGASPLLPLALLVVGALVAWGRRARTGAAIGGLARSAQPRRGSGGYPRAGREQVPSGKERRHASSKGESA
jgi:uncharacterized membrane protein